MNSNEGSSTVSSAASGVSSRVLLDYAQLAVALPTIIVAETIPSCPLPSPLPAQILMERATLLHSKFLLNTKAIPISDAFMLRKTLVNRPLQFNLRT